MMAVSTRAWKRVQVANFLKAVGIGMSVGAGMTLCGVLFALRLTA